MGESDPTKGRILFKEEKLSNLTVMVLVLVGMVVNFLLTTLWSNLWRDNMQDSMVFGAQTTIMITVISLPFVLARRFPLVIYEMGFEAPIIVLKFLQRNKRFVGYHDIKSLHPEYISNYGVTKLGGYTVITTEGEKIDIRDMDESKLKSIKKTFISALGDRWDKLYVDVPFLGYKELQSMQLQLARSKTSVWIEGLGTMSSSLFFLMFSLIVLSPSFMIISVLFTFFLWMVGFARLSSYYMALASYKKAVLKDPSLVSVITTHRKVKIEHLNPLKKIESFTAKDWERLQRSIHSLRPWHLIVFGSIVMFIGLPVYDFIPYEVSMLIVVSGIAIMMSALLYMPGLTKDTELVKQLVEQEVKLNRRIMPEWFKTRTRILTMLPFRHKPQYTDEEWRKLVSASKFRNEGRTAALVAGMVSMLILAVALREAFGFPKYSVLIMIALVMGGFLGYLYVYGGRFSTLRAIMDYEEQSSKSVVPEKLTETEMGSLKYTSPAYSIGKRAILAVLYVVSIAIPIALIMRFLQLYVPSNLNVYTIVGAIVWVLFIVGIEYLLVGIIVWRFVSPRLEIFENGMTRFVIPVFTNRKGDYVAFSDMKSFSVSEDGHKCYVRVRDSGIPLVWMAFDTGAVGRVVDKLRSEGIREIE
ncbi:MAG: hypothetical protein ACW99J_19800 [Candidatus Thorarchaeota archaeon]